MAFTQGPALNRFISNAEKLTTPVLDSALETWKSDPAYPLLLVGPAGSGRAEALCRFAVQRATAGEAVVLHHAGLMPPDGETPQLLWHVLVQLRQVAQIPQWPPQTEDGMREVLPNWLARAAACGPLWLLIADIDALAELDGGIPWLPGHWPPNLCLAASCVSGACARQLINRDWQPHYVDRNAGAVWSRPSESAPGSATADPASAATVGSLLALSRKPLETDALAAVSGLSAVDVKQALAALRPQIVRLEADRWAIAHPVCRQFLLDRYLPDDGPRQRMLEELAGHDDPLSAAAYYRQAWRPDRVLETLLPKESLLATEVPEDRMRWLAEWQALQNGSPVEALMPMLTEAGARLLLVASDLVEAAGDTVPEDWLARAANTEVPELYARARLGQAQSAIQTGDWTAAARHAQETLSAVPEETTQVNARHELGRAAEGLGDLEQATAIYEQTLELLQARQGTDSPALLPAMGNLVGVLRASRRLEQAEQLAHRAVRIARTACGPAHPATATACDQMAAVAYAGSDYAAAETAYRETLDVVRAAFGPEHPATAAALHNLGTTLDARQAFVDAEACYRSALVIRESIYGRENEETAATLHNLAAVLDTVGRTDEAERLYRETTDIWERIYGAEHVATVTSLTNLAGVLGSRGAYADAEICYRAAVEGWRRLVGDQHPNTLTTLADLGCLYAEGGQPELAGPLLEHVVETSRNILGVSDVHHVNSVCSLAALWRDQGRINEARGLLTDTLAGAERGLGLLAPPVQRLRRQLDTLSGATLH